MQRILAFVFFQLAHNYPDFASSPTGWNAALDAESAYSLICAVDALHKSLKSTTLCLLPVYLGEGQGIMFATIFNVTWRFTVGDDT